MATKAEDRRRCAQCTNVALGIFPKMLQDILADTKKLIQPSHLYRMLMHDTTFKKILKPDEKIALNGLLDDDFSKLDVGLIYKIFKTVHLIKEPTRDWGPYPSENDIEIGDDVERIRFARNDLFHKVDPYVSEQLYDQFFETILAVSKRLDRYLNKNADSSYEKLVQEYKLETLDTTTEETLLYDRAREGCFELITKCIIESPWREIHIMARKTLADDLERCASTEGDSVSPIKIIIDGIDDVEDFIQLLNSLKNEITTEFIELIRAEKGCIILFAEVKNKAIHDTKLFVNEVTCLLRTVFSMCKFACKADQITYAVITSAEEECIRDDLVESEEEGQTVFGNDDSVVLHVDMKNTTFAFTEKSREVFTDFFENVVKIGNGQQLIGQKIVHAVLVRDRDEKEEFDFGTEAAMIQAIDKDDNKDKHKVRMYRQMEPLVIPDTHIQHSKRGEEENQRRLEEENQRKRLEEENQRRWEEENQRRRLAEENQRRLEEENQRRRLAEENQRRLEEENQRRRLAEENRRRLEEENRRRLEEENRRRQEEETRKKQEEERKRQKEKDLNEEVQFWKTVRNETLPNLERLRQELEIANEKIRNARTARNATVAATLFGGALFSIFTGGASMAAAVGAVAVTGVAGITLLIETYVEKDVLSRTQEGINKDKEATLRLITRVRAYKGTESIPFAETLFTVRLESIDDLARDPLQTFISSLFDVQSNSLRKAIDRIIEFKRQLEKELQEVERVQRQHQFQ